MKADGRGAEPVLHETGPGGSGTKEFQVAGMRPAGPACNPGQMPLRCHIVDDSSDFLRSARALLERQGVTVVGVASTGAEAIEQAEALWPDVLLLDIDLGQDSGFELARRLRTQVGLA